MNHDADMQGASDEYVSLGYFEPLFGKRIIDRLSRHHVRFIARDASRMDVASAGTIDYLSWHDPYPIPVRNNRIELLIYSEDQDKARKVIDEM